MGQPIWLHSTIRIKLIFPISQHLNYAKQSAPISVHFKAIWLSPNKGLSCNDNDVPRETFIGWFEFHVELVPPKCYCLVGFFSHLVGFSEFASFVRDDNLVRFDIFDPNFLPAVFHRKIYHNLSRFTSTFFINFTDFLLNSDKANVLPII